MNFKNFYPYKFDWGHITTEAYNNIEEEVTFIFNFDIRSQSKIDDAIQYVVGRLCWGIINFPPKTTIKMMFDLRGQEIIVSRSKKFKETLLDKMDKIKIVNKIIIEFLR